MTPTHHAARPEAAATAGDPRRPATGRPPAAAARPAARRQLHVGARRRADRAGAAADAQAIRRHARRRRPRPDRAHRARADDRPDRPVRRASSPTSIDRKRLLLVAMVAYAVFGTAPLYLSSLGAIVGSRVLVGVCEAAIMTCCTTLIGDYWSGEQRGRYLGLQTLVAALSATVFLGLGGALGAAGWRTPFWLYVVALLLAVPMARYLWQPARPPAEARRCTAGSSRMPWRQLLAPCLVTLFGGVVFYALIVELSFVLTGVGVTSTATIGGISAVMSLATAAGRSCSAGVSGSRPARCCRSSSGCPPRSGGRLRHDSVPSSPSEPCSPGSAPACCCPPCSPGRSTGSRFDQRGRGTGLWTGTLFIGEFLSPLVLAGHRRRRRRSAARARRARRRRRRHGRGDAAGPAWPERAPQRRPPSSVGREHTGQVALPGGRFAMGDHSTRATRRRRGPGARGDAAAVPLDATAVTNAQFATFVKAPATSRTPSGAASRRCSTWLRGRPAPTSLGRRRGAPWWSRSGRRLAAPEGPARRSRPRQPPGRPRVLARRPGLLPRGRASGCPPRPSGSTPRAAGSTAPATPGATS